MFSSEPDPDPDGAKLIQTSDPLGEASKLVEMLVRHAAGKLTSHLLAAEVALRKGRHVVAMGSVRKAAQVAESGLAHPDVHLLVLKLAMAGKRRVSVKCTQWSGKKGIVSF